jgi:hypothetical protein
MKAFAAAALLGLVTAATALAQYEQTPPRFVGTLTSASPATGTGFHEEIDYFNPDAPDEKPYAVQRIVIDLHEGTRIDTSVPEQCKASSDDFMTKGADACPPESRVGGGVVEIDTGSTGGPLPRIIKNELTLFNDEDTIILFTESTNTDPAIRNAGRSIAKDGQFISEAPSLPGFPPPEPYTAIRSVRLDVENVSAVVDGKSRYYLTTPSECTSGEWRNTATFTYRSGAEYSVESTTPCHDDVSDRKLRVRLRGVPRDCVRDGFRLRGRVVGTQELRKLRVFLDGERVFTTQQRRFSRRVRTAQLAAGRHRVRAIATGTSGERARASRVFRRCARPAGRPAP